MFIIAFLLQQVFGEFLQLSEFGFQLNQTIVMSQKNNITGSIQVGSKSHIQFEIYNIVTERFSRDLPQKLIKEWNENSIGNIDIKGQFNTFTFSITKPKEEIIENSQLKENKWLIEIFLTESTISMQFKIDDDHQNDVFRNYRDLLDVY